MYLKNDKWKIALAVSLDLLFVSVSLFSRKITEMMMSRLGDCEIYKKLGIKCLTCGGTRCVNALSRGQIFEAFSYNAFVPVLLFALLVLLVLLNASWIFHSEKAKNFLLRLCNIKLVAVTGGIVLAYLLGRNILPVLYKIV